MEENVEKGYSERVSSSLSLEALFCEMGMIWGIHELKCVNMLCKLQSVADVTGGDDGNDTERQTLRAGTSKAANLTPSQCWVTSLIFLQSGHPA